LRNDAIQLLGSSAVSVLAAKAMIFDRDDVIGKHYQEASIYRAAAAFEAHRDDFESGSTCSRGDIFMSASLSIVPASAFAA